MLKKSILMLGLTGSVVLGNDALEEGTYSIISKHSGNCIEIESPVENSKIIQSVCSQKDEQKFSFTKISDTEYSIGTLSIAFNTKSNGANIFNTTEPSEFILEKTEGAFYKIKIKSSEKYLTAKPYTNEVIQYHGHASDDQLWSIGSDISSPKIFSTCKEILDSGLSHGNGVYTIDPDKEGAVEPFEVYCDMTSNGGGWTLFANHKNDLTLTESNSITLTEYGILNDENWNALKATMTEGMMFIDENNQMSTISKTKLYTASICTNLTGIDTLNRPSRSWVWHQEISGCGATGSDYSVISLGGGHWLYNLGSLKFDIWPYSDESSAYHQNELRYYLK